MKLLFCGLSLVDFVLTKALLSNGTCYEANPFAHWLLGTFGWAGLAVYKLAVVSVVLVTLAMMIQRQHQDVADRVCKFACIAAGLVIGWSLVLMFFKS